MNAANRSYLPGRWTALVTSGLCLLADVPLADPVLARCWKVREYTDAADVMLGEMLAQRSFVLLARDRKGLRLVVAGTAHAEVFAGSGDPVVYGRTSGRGTRMSAQWPQGWTDDRLDDGLDVRLVADDATPFERLAPLPLSSGIVLASYMFDLAGASAAAAEPVGPDSSPDEAVGWIPSPLADEPAPQLSGVFRALPWRSSLPDPDVAEPGASGIDGPLGRSDAEPDVRDRQDAIDSSAAEVVPDHAGPPPVVQPSGPSPESQAAAPLVQAVMCVNGHRNPVHAEACRVCRAGFAPQQPVTVARPPLGMLRLPTGAVVVLDRDALLGRAPFAVDRSIRLIELESPANDISRSHVRVTLDGWQVFVTDLGSTNGTAVTVPGHPAVLLSPHEPFALTGGAVLSLADEAEVRFDVV